MDEILAKRILKIINEDLFSRCPIEIDEISTEEDDLTALREFGERVLRPPGFKSDRQTNLAMVNWLLYHYRRPGDRTSIFQRMRPHFKPREPLEQEVWDALHDSVYRLWEVVGVDPGRGAQLRTCFGPEEEAFVPERALSECETGTLFYARVFKVRGIPFITCLQFTMGAIETKAEILEDLKILYEEYRGEYPENDEIDFFRHWEDEVVVLEFKGIDPAVEDLPWDYYDEHSEEELRKEYQEQFLPEYYEQWLDTALPALLGATPRKASSSAEGRSRLNEILKSMARQPEDLRGSDDYFEWARGELGIDEVSAKASARLYSAKELREMIRLARDANLDTLRKVEPVFFQDLPEMTESVNDVNAMMLEESQRLNGGMKTVDIQRSVKYLLDLEAHTSLVRHYLKSPNRSQDSRASEKAAFEQYKARSAIAVLNTQFRALENNPIGSDITLREILMILPEEVLEAVALGLDIKIDEGISKRKAIGAWLQSKDNLLWFRGQLKSRELDALEDLLKRGGWMKRQSFVRKYGEDKMDFWYWKARFPRKVLSVLRHYFLVWVGEHPEHGKIVIVPEDLRQKLRS